MDVVPINPKQSGEGNDDVKHPHPQFQHGASAQMAASSRVQVVASPRPLAYRPLRKAFAEELKQTSRLAYDMDFLSHLSFQPAAQRWARDLVQEQEEWLCEANPSLVSYVIVLRRAEAFATTESRAVAALQDALLQQFATARLLVCEQDDPDHERDLFIGVYASLDALMDEKRNVMSENFLSWTGSDIAQLPAPTRVTPSETMLLTRRIIDRAIDFIRVRCERSGTGTLRRAYVNGRTVHIDLRRN